MTAAPRMIRLAAALGLSALAVVASFAAPAAAQDRGQNVPGAFDFYVLSLSWSPSFCAQAAERGSSGRAQAQCGGRPHAR